jgi:hypothetical protein
MLPSILLTAFQQNGSFLFSCHQRLPYRFIFVKMIIMFRIPSGVSRLVIWLTITFAGVFDSSYELTVHVLNSIFYFQCFCTEAMYSYTHRQIFKKLQNVSIDNPHPNIFITPFDVYRQRMEELFKSTCVASSNSSNIESDEEFFGFE